MRVLVVEDDDSLAANMRLMLAGEGWIVHRCKTGDEAIHYIKNLSLDVVTLDLSLPDMDGFKVLRAMPERSKRPPIICVSALDPVEMKIAALRAGAADYIVKPFHRNELLARIHAVTRRYNGRAENIVEIGEFNIDLMGRTVSFRGVDISLSVCERAVLMRLASRPGWLFSSEDLLIHTYEDDAVPESRTLIAFIHRLRQKFIAVSAGEPLIECWFGQGYKLKTSARLLNPGKPRANARDWFERLGLDEAPQSEPVA